MTGENFSIGAFYNITKNQDNPIKTVGGDSFLSPKTHQNTSFLGVTQPPGVTQPYILGYTTRPRHITYVQVSSKSDQRRLRKTLHKQTDRQTNRHYENNGHLAVNQYSQVIVLALVTFCPVCVRLVPSALFPLTSVYLMFMCFGIVVGCLCHFFQIEFLFSFNNVCNGLSQVMKN